MMTFWKPSLPGKFRRWKRSRCAPKLKWNLICANHSARAGSQFTEFLESVRVPKFNLFHKKCFTRRVNMKGKMEGVTLVADWDPKPGFKLGKKDIEGRQTYLGSLVWRNPRFEIREYDIPTPGDDEVLLEVKACGICGSDVHMAQADKNGYIFYPGLTGFPSILGHELSGVVVEWGKKAYDKNTNKPFKGGEAVTTEEMLWCGNCKPCADGWPNHCERLDEIGFNVNGAYTKYIVVPARTLWSLDPLRSVYKNEQDLFVAGSICEPTSVAYNAVIERGGGIRPGDRVVILGAGPVGLAACAILKHAGASKVIISETQENRAKMALQMGADYHINP